MRSVLALTLLLVLSTPSWAGGRRITSQDLVSAINQADAAKVPFRWKKLSLQDVRKVHCKAPKDQPTQYDCRWEQHFRQNWSKRSTWLAFDGDRPVVID